MPWYKVPLSVYLEAAGPDEAQAAALELAKAAEDPSGPLSHAGYPVELTSAQLESHRTLREILAQADRDSADGLVVTDPRWPGVVLSPGAAAALAALEIEDQQGKI